jgi:hypothetical protein
MTSAISRRRLLTRLAAVGGAALAWSARGLAQNAIPIVVYKDPNCGCCHKWVEHMNASGFAATVKDTSDVNSIKRARQVSPSLWSCHTALVGDYVIEGHVPASDVKRLLAQRPEGIIGLTIPGMPASAPGMDLKPFQPFTVLGFDARGRTSVFAKHDKG